MKWTILTVLLLLNTGIKAQSFEENEVQDLIQNMVEDVFSEFNTEKIQEYFTADAIFFENGVIHTPDSMTEFLQELKSQFQSEENKQYTFKRENSFEFLKTTIQGDYAWIYYQNYADYSMDGVVISKFHWLGNANLVKENGKWKIQFLHSTIVNKK